MECMESRSGVISTKACVVANCLLSDLAQGTARMCLDAVECSIN